MTTRTTLPGMVAVAALATAACGAPAEPADSRPAAETAGYVDATGTTAATMPVEPPECPRFRGDQVERVRLTPAFKVTKVRSIVFCTPSGKPVEATVTGAVPGGVGGRADSHEVADLLAMLAVADKPRSDGLCAAVVLSTPWFALVTTDGVTLRPVVPLDECGGPDGTTLKQLQHVHDGLFSVVEDYVRRSDGPS